MRSRIGILNKSRGGGGRWKEHYAQEFRNRKEWHEASAATMVCPARLVSRKKRGWHPTSVYALAPGPDDRKGVLYLGNDASGGIGVPMFSFAQTRVT